MREERVYFIFVLWNLIKINRYESYTGNAVKIRDGRAAVIVRPVKSGTRVIDQPLLLKSGKALPGRTRVRIPVDIGLCNCSRVKNSR